MEMWMLDNLRDKFSDIFRNIRGMGHLNEKNMQTILRTIRMALLEADVNFLVVKKFVNSIREGFVGSNIGKSMNPSMQVIKIVNEQLTQLLGEKKLDIKLDQSSINKIMVVGLQGSGKTTTCAKLANYFRKLKFTPILCACDIYRHAAVEQLQTLGKQLNITVVSKETKKVKKIAYKALKSAKNSETNLVIFDTAGRLHVDEQMMKEIKELKDFIKPNYIFFVADSMTGQDAVNSAKGFNDLLDVDGIILTKMDSDTRGGAALSMMTITGKPIVFSGVGEKISELEVFYPDRVASRILGMGDMLSLIEKVESTVSQQEAEKLTKKLAKNQFTFSDFLTQLKQIQKMGSISSILKMIPGLPSNVNVDTKELKRVEAIICSMTLYERENPKMINGQRRKRISNGSGTTPFQINQLLQRFFQMQKMMKNVSNPNFIKQFQKMAN